MISPGIGAATENRGHRPGSGPFPAPESFRRTCRRPGHLCRPRLNPGRLRWPWALACLGLALTLAGCNSGSVSVTSSRPLCLAGSTSVQPFAEKLAEVFMRQHPEIRIDVQGGGSSAGIYATHQGAADLGACSRELLPHEKGLVEIPIAWDGIALIVHPSNPLNNLGLEELRRIYQGRLTDWRDLGLPPHSIDLITREEGSGTRNSFEELVMRKAEITPGALVQDSNGAVRELVSSDPYSLGFISMGLVDASVKALAIDGVAPTRENVKNHTYKLVRRFLLVSREAPTARAGTFIDFILSPQGQKILEAEGLVGVKE
jgi:phosphate transport system substrate-binding protein